MVLGRKTNFFLGKTKKTIFLESGRIVYHFWFFVFPRKKLVFLPKTLPKTMFFLGKSWFFCPKPSFSWEKVGFSAQNHLFPRENQKSHLFGVWPHSFRNDGFFCGFF